LKNSIRCLFIIVSFLFALPGFSYLPMTQNSTFEKSSDQRDSSAKVSAPIKELLSAVVKLQNRSNTVDRVCVSSDGKRLTKYYRRFHYFGFSNRGC
jgi:hypothetical protein